MSMKVEQLRQTPTDELIRQHDAITSHVEWGVRDYLDELARRDAAAQTQQMLRLTWAIAIFSVIITAATIVNVVLVA